MLSDVLIVLGVVIAVLSGRADFLRRRHRRDGLPVYKNENLLKFTNDDDKN